MIDPVHNPAETVTALTDWKNPPKLSELKQHLEDVRTIHASQVSKIDGYLANLNLTGKAKLKLPDGNSQVQPKLIRKQAEWRYAALSEPFLSSPDIFNVSPVTWEDKEAAVQNEQVLNYQFNTKLNKVAFIDEYVRTAVDEGTVIVRVGWDFQEEEVEEDQPIVQFQFDQSFAPVLQHVDTLKNTSPSQYATDVPEEMKRAYELSQQNGAPMRPIVVGHQKVKKNKTVRNQPTLEICDYRNVFLDPTAKGDVSKMNFIGYSFETSLSELKKDSRYKNLDKINLANNSPLSQPDHASDIGITNFNFNDKPRTKMVAYELWLFWDIDNDGIAEPIVATWVGDTIIRMEEAPFPDKELPFVVVPYLPVRKSNYGEPDGALLEDNQKIIGAITRGMIDLMAKSANSQTGMRKDMLDTTNRRKFDKGLDYEFNPGVNPHEGVFMHKFPEIPQSAMQMVQLQNQEAESLTGVKSFAQGMSGNSLGDVAAGVRGALDASSKRELGILRRLAAGMESIGRKIIAMNAEFLSEEEVIRVTNGEFIKIRRDDLPGNFDLKLSISTAEEDDNKAKELAFMLQTVGPNEDPGLRAMILSEICRLRKMPDLAHVIKDYKPQPDPLQQQMQQLQLQLLQAQVNETNAKAQSLVASAELHQSKAGTEQVKQGHLQADTDQKNLDFVEQESGVKQERELEKQREAASHQAQLTALQQSQSAAHTADQSVLQHHLDKKLESKKK